MVNRRSVLVGLGGLAAGGGVVLGTGAFTTVEAERTVTVETAADADAFLALSAENEDYVGESTDLPGTIEIFLDGSQATDPNVGEGLNRRAITTFRNLVRVTNQGTQTVSALELAFTTVPASVNAGDTFSFTVDEAGGSGQEEVANGENILTGDNGIPSELTPGESVIFGLRIDLINGGDDQDLPDGGDYTLTITADTQA